MRSHLFRSGFAAVVLLFFYFSANAQDSPQTAVASKTAKFETITNTDAVYAGAMDAHKLDDAKKLIGKEGSFRGTVTKVFSPKSGTVVILNFDRDYKTALTAVLNKSDFAKFPDLAKLDGKEVVISGKYIDYHDTPEIVLTDPKQVSLVK